MQIFTWFEAKGGQIVDATFVPTRQPTGTHKKQLREEVPLTEAQARQIDNDATFTKKGDVSYHGYKNHTGVDAKYKLIRKGETTPASVHDSQKLADIVTSPSANATEEDKKLWGDSAYRSAEIEAMLTAKNITSEVHDGGIAPAQRCQGIV